MARPLLSYLIPVIAAVSVCGQSPPDRPTRRGLALPAWARSSWIVRRSLEPQWALVGGNVIDVATDAVHENVNIVIAGDMILSVSTDPDGKQVGLWLMTYDSDAGVYKGWFFSPDSP